MSIFILEEVLYDFVKPPQYKSKSHRQDWFIFNNLVYILNIAFTYGFALINLRQTVLMPK